MNISEKQLINQIKSQIQFESKDIAHSIGDDCAVLEYDDTFYELLSTDMLIENIHFDLNNINLEQVGYKACAVNISDICAMGGMPKTILVSLGIPCRFNSKDIENLYKGIIKCAELFDISICGGDITGSNNDLIINISITGLVEKENLVLRSTTKDKDLIYVTGALGASIKKKHYSFTPCLKQARYLTENSIASSMMDISDGLASDLREILDKSKCHGTVLFKEKIPVSDDCKNIYKGFDEQIEHALTDGEDFELLFTVSPDRCFKPLIDCYHIGYIDNEKDGIYLLDKDEKLKKIDIFGFEHF